MRRSTLLMALAIALILYLTCLAAQSSASKEVIMMVGDITAIDHVHKTVVVEVAVGKSASEEKLFTVGGPLSPEAVLTNGGQSAKLEDFKVGDWVTVKWKLTEQGHLILSLKAK